MRVVLAAILAAALGACVSVNADVTTHETTLAAINSASVRECPPDRVAADAFSAGETENVGLTGENIVLVPLASDPTRVIRMRRLTLAPGGTIAWHDHRAVQGMALVVSGELQETRNSCRDQMIYRAGDVAREDEATAHSWRNIGDEAAVVIVAHVVAR